MTQKGIINLQTYSRPPLLELCLNSISECSNSIDFEKIIVLQVGNKEVESLVEAFCAKNRNSIIIRVDGQEKSPLQNMNWNRWKAWQHGFDNLGADWILSIEEDVVIHPKSIDFVCEVMIRMSNQKHFRGINLGSKLADPELNCTYSKLRFGLHGCAAVITADTWHEIRKLRIEKKLNQFPLDVCIEHILKDGFMVTPNLSLYLDYGWYQGTHTNPDSKNPHYLEVAESFGSNQAICRELKLLQIEHNWREDCISFSESDNFRFQVRKYASLVWTTSGWQSFYRFLRNFKRFILGKTAI